MNAFFDSFRNRYRLDNVPWWWQPLFWLYGYGLGLPLYGYFRLVRATARFEFLDAERWRAQSPVILACWHRDTLSCFTAFQDYGKFTGLFHPPWYMHPAVVFTRLLGFNELYLGSTGNAGRAAADQLVAAIKAGRCTLINPDGPSGPAGFIRKGILHIARQSGAPIVAVRVSCSLHLRLGGWDLKRIPLPFSRIKFQFQPPIKVESDDFDPLIAKLKAALSEEEG